MVAGQVAASASRAIAATASAATARRDHCSGLAVASLVRRPVFAWYVLLALTLSMLSGYAYTAWAAR